VILVITLPIWGPAVGLAGLMIFSRMSDTTNQEVNSVQQTAEAKMVSCTANVDEKISNGLLDGKYRVEVLQDCLMGEDQ